MENEEKKALLGLSLPFILVGLVFVVILTKIGK
jgi:hypothetical protein